MTEAWRNHYDRWKTDADKIAAGFGMAFDEDGNVIDQDELDARAEDAAIERAERAREDAMFDRDSLEDW